ncbi:MAG: EAL domain-containing protein, partial [Anaerolineae bacterium]|nr:EAL domain-containing protein [Anaerolineae bacterium]
AAAIGWRLGITERTVGFHLQNVRSKLQVKTLPQAVARALLLGLLKPIHDIDAAASWSQKVTAPSRLDARLRCDSLIAQTVEKGTSFAMLLLEIDHFKRIHQAMDDLSGNAILARFAHRIQDCLPPESFFAHLSGNEFLLLIPAADHELACGQAEKLLQLARRPIVWQECEIGLTISVGIALAPAHGNSWSSLMKAADQALVQAKKNGRDRYRIHQQQQPEAGAKIQLQLESELRKALRQEELELHYQPIVSATTGAWRGLEALLRWNHPRHGELAPERLIALAEGMGLIHELGFWIIQTACRQLRICHQQRPELFMSVNLSTLQLQHPQFAHKVAQIVAAEDIPPSLLELEITEQLLLEQTEDVHRNLHQLKNAGIVLSIDDFGMGHAGFGYLLTLNVHRIKIDRSFISQIHQKPERLALVKAMIQMGHGLGAQLIAEGVECEQEWHCLKTLNCDLLQGFFFSKPMPGCHLDPANQVKFQQNRKTPCQK